MATTTQYYDLIKPEYSDDADIGDINDNMDTIDGALHDLADTDDDIRELIGVIPEGSTVSGQINEVDQAKISKVSGATNGNFATLNSGGGVTDSGKKPTDFVLAANVATDAETAEMLDEVFGGGE